LLVEGWETRRREKRSAGRRGKGGGVLAGGKLARTSAKTALGREKEGLGEEGRQEKKNKGVGKNKRGGKKRKGSNQEGGRSVLKKQRGDDEKKGEESHRRQIHGKVVNLFEKGGGGRNDKKKKSCQSLSLEEKGAEKGSSQCGANGEIRPKKTKRTRLSVGGSSTEIRKDTLYSVAAREQRTESTKLEISVLKSMAKRSGKEGEKFSGERRRAGKGRTRKGRGVPVSGEAKSWFWKRLYLKSVKKGRPEKKRGEVQTVLSPKTRKGS